MAPKGLSVGIMDQDIGFSLGRLFDEYNMDHIPYGKRLNGLKKRNLAHIKHYKAAVNIFGGPLSRKRSIVAPPMETPLKHRLGIYHNQKAAPELPVMNAAVVERPPLIKALTAEEEQVKEEDERSSHYKSWMMQRKKLRKDLDGMGLTDEYLDNKVDKTDLEKRVMCKLIDISREKAELIKAKKKPKLPPSRRNLPIVPKIASPAPIALQIMDEHLTANNIRLLDLFKFIDKDKNWKATKQEFKEAVKKVNLPITDKEIEDMIVCLDEDINDELDYSELAHGLRIWRRERRDNRRKSNASSVVSDAEKRRPLVSSKNDRRGNRQSPVSLSNNEHSDSSRSRPRSRGSAGQKQSREGSSSKSPDYFDTPLKIPFDTVRSDSARSWSRGSSCSSPRYLEVPETDLQVSRMILSSDEAAMDLIKHDKEVLRRNIYRKKYGITVEDEPAPGIIKIGDKSIDDHSNMSTLGGSSGPLVDKFRQKRLEEYKNVVNLCKERGIVLTPKLLDKVLLYPADKQHHLIQEKICVPADPLITSKFAKPSKPAKPSLEDRHKDKIKRSRSGQLVIDSRHIYRKGQHVTRNVTKENLSTGKALIKTKVDTWMTFEEYDRLTCKHAVRYKHLNPKSDGNAFWPGQLLDKLYLCMPPYDTPVKPKTEAAVFTTVKPTRKTNPGFNNDISWWPVNDAGYLQTGNIDRFYRRS